MAIAQFSPHLNVSRPHLMWAKESYIWSSTRTSTLHRAETNDDLWLRAKALFHILFSLSLPFLSSALHHHCCLKAAKRFMFPAFMSPPILRHLKLVSLIKTKCSHTQKLSVPRICFSSQPQKCHVLGTNGNRTAITSHHIESFCCLTFRFFWQE